MGALVTTAKVSANIDDHPCPPALQTIYVDFWESANNMLRSGRRILGKCLVPGRVRVRVRR